MILGQNYVSKFVHILNYSNISKPGAAVEAGVGWNLTYPSGISYLDIYTDPKQKLCLIRIINFSTICFFNELKNA